MAKLLDPVCGMTVDDTALRAEGYDDVAFCAPGCRKRFLDNPSAYPDRLDTSDASSGGGCGCGHGEHADHGGHGHHRKHAGASLKMVESTTASDAGGGCCGGHGH